MTYYTERMRESFTTYTAPTRLMALVTTLLLWLEALPLLRSRLGYVLCTALGIGRRWGVRCFAGQSEKVGFLYRSEAEAWGRTHYGANYVAFYYVPLDLRILPSEHEGRVRCVSSVVL